MLSRRQLLKLLASTTLLSTLPTTAAKPAVRFLSCRTDNDDQHYATVFNAAGGILWDVSLPARGHDIQLSPDGRLAVVFARRPGVYMWVLDIDEYSIIQKIKAPSNRLFYGHGVFSEDQSILFTTENDFGAARGVIGIYDAGAQYQRIGEYSSFGVGAHELLLMPDHSTLVIANGGIHTHPDFPRTRLNLDTMVPNLAYVDSQSGKLKSKYTLPEKWHQLSIRHIDVNTSGQVAIAMQHKGPKNEQPPLIALHSGENELSLLRAPDDIHRRMKNYCGSAAFIRDGSEFSISSPRGNLLTHWKRNGQYIGHSEQDDASGLASVGNQMWASDGRGKIMSYRNAKADSAQAAFSDTRWDNHLTVST